MNASTRGKSNRRKGQDGERELANTLGEILGITLKRRVRNHKGESDITGLDGFCVEVKKQAVPALRTWWDQTTHQAFLLGEIPVLFYRLPRKEFRAILSLGPFLGDDGEMDADEWNFDYTLDMSLQAFAVIYRFIERSRGEREIEFRDAFGIRVN